MGTYICNVKFLFKGDWDRLSKLIIKKEFTKIVGPYVDIFNSRIESANQEYERTHPNQGVISDDGEDRIEYNTFIRSQIYPYISKLDNTLPSVLRSAVRYDMDIENDCLMLLRNRQGGTFTYRMEFV